MCRIYVYEQDNECEKEFCYLEIKNESHMTRLVVELFLNYLLYYEPPHCFHQMMYDLSVYFIVGRPYVD